MPAGQRYSYQLQNRDRTVDTRHSLYPAFRMTTQPQNDLSGETWRLFRILAEFVDGFEMMSDVSKVVWYYAFGVFKLIVILQQIYIRFLRGQTQDPRFAALGPQIEALAHKGTVVISSENDLKTAY